VSEADWNKATGAKSDVEKLAREAARLLAESSEPQAPATAARGRLLARVADYARLRPAADVRRDEGNWVESGVAGVTIRNLFHDGESRLSTYMVRMEPGARFPAHRHGADEQCLVLSGDIGWGDVVYRAGDFVAMGKGSSHPEIFTREGNTLLIVAGRNELI
jgi:anti-sigma factor ChrR (cupin superfamily)